MENNKVTLKELQERQRWTLNQKIDHSLYIIDSFLAQVPTASIAFSGGIDSTVLLYLCRMLKKDIPVVFINTTNEFSEIVKFVKNSTDVQIIHPKITFIESLEKYGFPLISKLVSGYLNECRNPTEKNKKNIDRILNGKIVDGKLNTRYSLPHRYKFLLNSKFEISDKCCDYLKKYPFSKINKNGIFIGTMASDSEQRLSSYLKTSCINLNNKKASPLSIWNDKNIWKFIKQNNIPYYDIYDKGETSTGCAYCGFGCMFDRLRFARLKEREPKRYKIIMNVKNNGVTYKEALGISMKLNLDSHQPTLLLK